MNHASSFLHHHTMWTLPVRHPPARRRSRSRRPTRACRLALGDPLVWLARACDQVSWDRPHGRSIEGDVQFRWVLRRGSPETYQPPVKAQPESLTVLRPVSSLHVPMPMARRQSRWVLRRSSPKTYQLPVQAQPELLTVLRPVSSFHVWVSTTHHQSRWVLRRGSPKTCQPPVQAQPGLLTVLRSVPAPSRSPLHSPSTHRRMHLPRSLASPASALPCPSCLSSTYPGSPSLSSRSRPPIIHPHPLERNPVDTRGFSCQGIG